MKKIIKAILTAAVLCIISAVTSMCVFAANDTVTEDLPVIKAKQTNGAWGQSITYDRAGFDCGRFTESTVIEVEFEIDGEWTSSNSPVELVLQNYSTAKPEIWAKISPFDFDETYAMFQYDDMVLSYGSDDFSTVDNMCLGDCGIPVKVTKFTVKNCKAPVETTVATTTTVETTAAITESGAETTSAPAETTASEASESSGGKIPIVPIVIVTVVVAVIVVVVIIVVKNKRRFY